jgi:hypothetical protein
MNRSSPSRLAPFFFLFFGLMPFLQVAYRAHGAVNARAWPEAPGVVFQTGVQSTSSTPAWHYPDVRCRYEVDGRMYHNLCYRESGGINGRLALDNTAYLARESALRRTAGYQVGQRVRVRYPPGRPEEGILEPGVWFLEAGTYIWLGLGLVSVVLGLHGWFTIGKSGKDSKPKTSCSV